MLAPGGQTQRCSCGSAGKVSEIFRLPTRTRTAVCGPALTGVRLGHPGQAHNTAICAAGIANAYYLGHVEPKNTYWYLSAVPELMQLVAARLEHGAGQS